MTPVRDAPPADPLAAEVCEPVTLDPRASGLLVPGLRVRAFVERLVEEELLADAVAVVAHWLPKRTAVDWACSCFELAASEAERQAAAGALGAARRWVKEQDEPSRRAAGKAAEEGRYRTGAALAAAGAFFSSGSLAPVSAGVAVPSPPLLTARAVAGAVSVSAVSGEPARAPAWLREFVRLGLERAADGAPRGGPG